MFDLFKDRTEEYNNTVFTTNVGVFKVIYKESGSRELKFAGRAKIAGYSMEKKELYILNTLDTLGKMQVIKSFTKAVNEGRVA